jgi:methyl-accepting chemotaxis protein
VDLPEMKRDDEVGALANAFRLMLKSLKDQTKQVLSGVTILTNTGEGISRAVSRLAETASESSDAVKKSTEIVDGVQREVRLSADKVRGVADQAGAITRSGVEAAEQTVLNMGIIKEQMQRIRASVDMLGARSQEIERIVVSVQDIADQSNLLAVNASIEAAQAGERGRGFAVVAHEIKTLANQSKKSTNNVQQFLKEITKSISAVTEATEAADKAVSSGVEHSALAGKSIRSLAGSVSASSDTVTAIEASSDIQALGLEEISSSITGVEKAVNQNAESAKELEDAVKELHRLGSQLSVLVSRFRVE